MLDLRPNCECCDKDLPPEATDALICTFECTFCADCAEGMLGGICPNCGGNFSARPIRPFVEPGILASVVALGLLVALAIDLPVAAGVATIGLFALLHGHAHGTEVPENADGLEYMAGFAVATMLLHAIGIAAGLGLGLRFRGLARVAGAACAAIGVGLVFGVV